MSRLAVVSVSEWTAFAESIVIGPLTAILMIASWVTFGTTPPDQLAARAPVAAGGVDPAHRRQDGASLESLQEEVLPAAVGRAGDGRRCGACGSVECSA